MLRPIVSFLANRKPTLKQQSKNILMGCQEQAFTLIENRLSQRVNECNGDVTSTAMNLSLACRFGGAGRRGACNHVRRGI
jgi:hypothetical protein